MASVVFLYRSTKDSARLTARLLFRIDKKDFILASKTKLDVTKTYWNKKHSTKSKDISVINKQTQINNELNKITQFILNEFDKSSAPDQLNNKWLTNQIDNYYKPRRGPKNIPKDIVRFIDYYIGIRRNEANKIGADTKEWYACFTPVDLNYCIAAEVYLESKWVEIVKNKDEQFLFSTINKAMKVGRFFTNEDSFKAK